MDPPDSASRVFCSRILSMVNADDVNAIILAQKNMLDRFEKTNEMLLNFNNLSSARLQQMSERFLHHTRTLVEMKRDLDSIFRRIRTLKGKLARQHPEAFSHIPEASLLEDEDEDPIPPSTTTTIATSEQSTGSCDTSPDTVSPSLSPGFEDLSHVRPGSPAINGHSHTDDEETPDPSARPGDDQSSWSRVGCRARPEVCSEQHLKVPRDQSQMSSVPAPWSGPPQGGQALSCLSSPQPTPVPTNSGLLAPSSNDSIEYFLQSLSQRGF
ncbi:kxDL motif-containing protein 1 isoform X1 [Phocoena phocoena]|uniref:kxDL motif-containing protein 1 isoform X1 n=1 Tax=Phocoena phocoena TaxID=9742 RepID=UPI00330754ED